MAAQLETNRQLNQLRSQIAQSNFVNQQILQNQIREIEEKETQKFYKNRVFKINKLVSLLNNCQDINQKEILYSFLGDAIINNITESIDALNEIPDKEYCSKMLEDFTKDKNDFFNRNTLSFEEELTSIKTGRTEFFSMKQNLDQFNTLYDKIEQETIGNPQNIKPNTLGIKILGVISLLTFIIMSTIFNITIGIGTTILPVIFLLATVKAYFDEKKEKETLAVKVVERQNMLTEIEQNINELKTKLENCEYTKAINSLNGKYPLWNSVLAENRNYLSE